MEVSRKADKWGKWKKWSVVSCDGALCGHCSVRRGPAASGRDCHEVSGSGAALRQLGENAAKCLGRTVLATRSCILCVLRDSVLKKRPRMSIRLQRACAPAAVRICSGMPQRGKQYCQSRQGGTEARRNTRRIGRREMPCHADVLHENDLIACWPRRAGPLPAFHCPDCSETPIARLALRFFSPQSSRRTQRFT